MSDADARPEGTPAGTDRADATPGDESAVPPADETRERAAAVARDPRWRVAVPATLSLVSLALLYASPLLLAAAVVPLGYVVYGSLSAVPPDASVRVERSVAARAPPPGERVPVTVTVANDGAATLPDVRVVDGVPAELAVVEGAPRRACTLRPGESATFTYEVVARRGEFAFGDAAVRLRSLAGSAVRTESVPAAGDDRLTCLYPLTGASGEATSLRRAGTHPTDSGGAGIEFRATRRYRPGDPKHRIHWRRFAKTGELTTVSYREERAVRTVLVVDARPSGRVAPRPGVPTGVDLCGYAGERLYEALTDEGVVTSVTALGVDATDLTVPVRPGGFPWADGSADGSATLARAVFGAVHDASGTGDESRSGTTGDSSGVAAGAQAGPADGARPVAGTAPDGGTSRANLLLSALPSGAEVVVVSPLLDDAPADLARTLRGQGYPVTVVSPDVTATGSAGGAVTGTARRTRLRRLEDRGVTAVGWAPDESLEVALAESVAHLAGGER